MERLAPPSVCEESETLLWFPLADLPSVFYVKVRKQSHANIAK
jgi:hypothetical protein